MKKIIMIVMAVAVIAACFCGCEKKGDKVTAEWEAVIEDIYYNDEGAVTAVKAKGDASTSMLSVAKNDLRLPNAPINVGDQVLISKHKDNSKDKTIYYYVISGLKSTAPTEEGSSGTSNSESKGTTSDKSITDKVGARENSTSEGYSKTDGNTTEGHSESKSTSVGTIKEVEEKLDK